MAADASAPHPDDRSAGAPLDGAQACAAPPAATLRETLPSTSLETLHDPAVRDLAWLLLSPSLLRAQPPHGTLASAFDTPAERDATLAWLRALDANPDALLNDLRATPLTRLGRYAERLLEWFLRHGPTQRLIAAGVPLRRAGVTLGECDFLLQSGSGERQHWELAVKCYLHAGTDADTDADAALANYVGPNLRDRFDLKFAHLLNHQLRLTEREEFASLGFGGFGESGGPWLPRMFVKGWLFYRHGRTPAEPAEIDPAHGRGWWVTQADFAAFAASHARRWRVLPRLEWLAPRRVEPCATVDAAALIAQLSAELKPQLSAQPGPTLVAAFVEDDAGGLIERSRGFIVPDDWPQRAQRYAASGAVYHQR